MEAEYGKHLCVIQLQVISFSCSLNGASSTFLQNRLHSLYYYYFLIKPILAYSE